MPPMILAAIISGAFSLAIKIVEIIPEMLTKKKEMKKIKSVKHRALVHLRQKKETIDKTRI